MKKDHTHLKKFVKYKIYWAYILGFMYAIVGVFIIADIINILRHLK